MTQAIFHCFHLQHWTDVYDPLILATMNAISTVLKCMNKCSQMTWTCMRLGMAVSQVYLPWGMRLPSGMIEELKCFYWEEVTGG